MKPLRGERPPVRHGLTLAVAYVVGVGVAGCTDEAVPTAFPEVTVPSSTSEPVMFGLSVDAAWGTLAQALALALDDAVVRQELFRDFQRSPFREGKLPLKQYVTSVERGAMGDALRAALGGSQVQLLSLLDELPEMELYVPVRAHREGWSGGDDVIVATLPTGRDIPIGFGRAGVRVQGLTAHTPPLTTVIAIVPAEVEFGWARDGSEFDSWLASTKRYSGSSLRWMGSGDEEASRGERYRG